MDEQALLFGVAAGPGSQPGKACGVKFDLLGAAAGGVDEGLDVNVHGFGSGPISVQSAPKGRFRIWRGGGGSAAGLASSEGGAKLESPTVLFLVTQIIQSSHELGVMREKQTLVG